MKSTTWRKWTKRRKCRVCGSRITGKHGIAYCHRTRKCRTLYARAYAQLKRHGGGDGVVRYREIERKPVRNN